MMVGIHLLFISCCLQYIYYYCGKNLQIQSIGEGGICVIKIDKLNFSEFNVCKTSLQRSLEQSVLIQFSLSFISVNLRE